MTRRNLWLQEKISSVGFAEKDEACAPAIGQYRMGSVRAPLLDEGTSAFAQGLKCLVAFDDLQQFHPVGGPA